MTRIRTRRIAASVLLTLAMVGITPATTAYAGHRRAVDVATYNLYLGGDLGPVLAAQNLGELVAATTAVYLQVVATDFVERADAIADQIEDAQPSLVGLQELSLWRTDTPADGPATPATEVTFDFLEILLDALADRGLDYEVVSVTNNFDGEAPTALGFDARLTDRDVILARSDLRTSELKLSNPQSQHFDENLTIASPVLGHIEIVRGWTSVDVKVRGKSFRFINTHLEAFSPPDQVAQAQELLAGPAATSRPVVMAGDFNSAADGSTTPTYGLLIGAGFTDAWSQTHPGESGDTCCQAADLLNAASQLDERIDLVLFRGDGFGATRAEILGEEQADRTESGLWPSDHAGVAAAIEFGPGPGDHGQE